MTKEKYTPEFIKFLEELKQSCDRKCDSCNTKYHCDEYKEETPELKEFHDHIRIQMEWAKKTGNDKGSRLLHEDRYGDRWRNSWHR